MKKHKGKILVLFLAVFLVSVLSCENPFLKKMLVVTGRKKWQNFAFSLTK